MSPYRSRNLKEHCNGTLHIGFGHISDKYTSRVIYDPSEQKIIAINLDGHVFSQMRSTWTFTDTTSFGSEGMKNGTDYEFKIEYKMGNPIYSKVAKAAFPTVSKQMVEAFEKRVENS